MQIQKRDNPLMGMVSKILKDSIPKPIPEMPMEQGFFRDWLYTGKLERIERASRNIRSIAENQNATFNSNVNTIVSLANLQNDQTEREQNYRNREVLRLEAEKQAQEKTKQEQLKTQNMFYSTEQERIAAEIAKFNLKKRMEDMENDR